MKNNVRKIWNKNGKVVNGWLSIPNSFSAEIMANQGYHSITIDTQHGVVEYSEMVKMLQAISTTDTTPIVRVPWLDPSHIMKTLDAGALGIICPMVNSGEEAKKLVEWASYPPRGSRSFGPTRAQIAHGSDYANKANEEVIILAMIETPGAMKNLDEICSTEGLSGVYVGPADLALSHGFKPGFDRKEPALDEMIKLIASTAKKYNLNPGIHTGSAEYAKKAFSWGYDLITLFSDTRLLSVGAKNSLKDMSEFFDNVDQSSSTTY